MLWSKRRKRRARPKTYCASCTLTRWAPSAPNSPTRKQESLTTVFWGLASLAQDTAKELSEDDIEFLCDNLETADAINAAAALFEGGDLAAVHDLVITTRERLRNDKAKDDRDAEAARANQMEAMRATMHQWTEDERSCLAK